MHVEVEHDLSPGGLVELLQGDAIGVESFHRGGSNLVGGAGDVGVIIGGGVEDILGGGLVGDKPMARGGRPGIAGRHYGRVLSDLLASGLSWPVFWAMG